MGERRVGGELEGYKIFYFREEGNKVVILFINLVIREFIFLSVILENLIRRICKRIYVWKNGENRNLKKL